MTRQELRVVLNTDWFCGCGSPETAAETLLQILDMAPFYDHREQLNALIPNDGIQHLVLYSLTNRGLIEHGCSIGGSWLTSTGEAVRDALRRERDDEFDELMASACSHGYATETDELLSCPTCGPMNGVKR